MTASEHILQVGSTLGGLALFIYGMRLTSEGLQALAGGRIRYLLQKVTTHRLSAFGIGNLASFLIHTGATTVMVVGFINAGLLSLTASIPIILGANVGTTLSMQLLSFKIGQYCYFAIGAGVLMILASKRVAVRQTGMLFLGFGLIFLGMTTMDDAIVPFKNSGYFDDFLAITHGGTTRGLVVGIVAGAVLTAVLQSSGATIGMLFALAMAGVFTDLRQAFPLLLGSHIGTCSATVLGSLGTSIEARRSVLAHLFFNIAGTLLAAFMAPLYFAGIPFLGGSLVHQIANAHTAVQLLSAVLLLPFTAQFASLIEWLTPSSQPKQDKSHLDDGLLMTPEMALVAAILETRRMAVITRKMVRQSMEGFVKLRESKFAMVVEAETSVNLLRDAINAYLRNIALRQLSSRQSMLVQLLVRAVAEIERIGDHASSLVRITQDKKDYKVRFDKDSMTRLVDIYTLADNLLEFVTSSLDPANMEVEHKSGAMLEAYKTYHQASADARNRYKERILAGHENATNGWAYAAYLHAFDRIVEHARDVTQARTDPLFRLKPGKFRVRATPLVRKLSPTDPGALHVDTAIFDVSRVDQHSPKLAPPAPIDEEVTVKSDLPTVRRSSKKR